MSQERIIIGVDAYNGDSIPINNKEVSVTERVAEAVSMVREKNPNIELLVNYDESSLKDLAIAIKKEEIGGFFSIGDTGKVCRESIRLRRIQTKKGKIKPVLAALVATAIEEKDCIMVDAGAINDIEDSYDVYCQSLMTASYATHFLGIKQPKLGILCNGIEEHKGNKTVKGTHKLLKQGIKYQGLSELLDYQGKVEPETAMFGSLDILVSTDGFIGNIYLKTCEGAIKLGHYLVKQKFKKLKGMLNQGSAFLGKRAIREVGKEIREKFSPKKYNGALLLGYKGVIVKGHGASSAEGIYGGILRTEIFVEKDVTHEIKEDVNKYG